MSARLKILAQQWAPAVAAGFKKESGHRALSDIRDSIAELQWYRSRLLDQDTLRLVGTGMIEKPYAEATARNVARQFLSAMRRGVS